MRIRNWAKDDNDARGARLGAAEYQGRQDLCGGTG
jgi:hypothetical protein